MTSQGFSQGFGDVRARARQGLNGNFAKVSHLNAFLTGINESPQSKQVTTINVADVGDDVSVVLTINGMPVAYNSGTGRDQDANGLALVAAINAESLVRGAVVPTYAAGVLTLTGKLPGDTFTVVITTAGGMLSGLVTVAANTADDIPFGRAVLFQGTNPGEVEDLVALAKLPRFTPQVLTVTVVTGQANARIATLYEILGDERVVLAQVGFTGSATAANEATAIAQALNAALPTNTVVATTSTADLILTAEVAGLEFELDIQTTVGATVAVYTIVPTTGPSFSTSFHRAFVGISLYSAADESATIGGLEGRYVANRGITYAVRGEIYLTNDQRPATNDPVYVELADGDDSGKFFNTPSTTRLRVTRGIAQWRRNATLASDNLTVLHIDTDRAP